VRVSGRGMQLVKQTGEFLVAAELCRRGYVATTFAGSMPDFDILAVSGQGETFCVQVKTIRGVSWQLDASKYLDIHMEGKAQVIQGKRLLADERMICVFMALSEYGEDEFFILTAGQLQDKILSRHTEYMQNKSWIRPKSPNSFHVSIQRKHLGEYKDNWELLPGSRNTDDRR